MRFEPILGQFSAQFFWLKIGRNENFIMQSGYGEQTFLSETIELMKQNHLLKVRSVIFLKGAVIDLHTLRRLRYPNPLSAILEDFF